MIYIYKYNIVQHHNHTTSKDLKKTTLAKYVFAWPTCALSQSPALTDKIPPPTAKRWDPAGTFRFFM